MITDFGPLDPLGYNPQMKILGNATVGMWSISNSDDHWKAISRQTNLPVCEIAYKHDNIYKYSQHTVSRPSPTNRFCVVGAALARRRRPSLVIS